MKIIIINVFLLFSFFLSSQVETKLIVGGFKANTITPFDLFPLAMFNNSDYSQNSGYRNYGIITGLELNKKLSLSVELMFMNLADGSSYGGTRNQNMKTLKSGLNLSYRFSENCVLSPKVGLRGGFTPYSDIIGKTVDPGTLNSDVIGEETGQFEFASWNSYGSIDAMLSVRLKSFDLEIGTELNYQIYSLTYKPYYGFNSFGIHKTREFGIGLKASILFMIPLRSENGPETTK